MSRGIRIGTRRSVLAQVQTQLAVQEIRKYFPGLDITVVPIATTGDQMQGKNFGSFSGKGIFTKELEQKLLNGEIDLAVHSAKDLPLELPEGLTIGAVLERMDLREVLVLPVSFGFRGSSYSKEGRLQDLPEGSRIGTGSLRRQLQVEAANSSLTVLPIRGNVQTRLKKLKAGEYDALILAEAGLKRLFTYDADRFQYEAFAYFPIDLEEMLPAPAQGILALECREGDLIDLLSEVHSQKTGQEFVAERSFLKQIDGGCNAPAAALAQVRDGRMEMKVMYAPDGKTMRFAQGSALPLEGKELGERLALETKVASTVEQPAISSVALESTLEQDAPVEKGVVSSSAPESSRVQGTQAEKSIDFPSEPASALLPQESVDAAIAPVWLIGAGPGDPGLLSQKGLAYLKKANVVLYDHLANPAVLNEVRPDAEIVYAGKKSGEYAYSQAEINEKLIAYAKVGKSVARLKGGDVFVFGRGCEECLALAQAGVPFEIIPGVSSAYAVPAYQGIPVTERSMASSFHVITGQEDIRKEESVLDYRVLAQEEGTLVFLMGRKNLASICEKLLCNGKDPHTPAAVLEAGTSAHQRMAVGTLQTIPKEADRQKIGTPALIVIGAVVSLHEQLHWYGGKPLSGRKVLITATKSLADELTGKLLEQGAEPVPLSLIRTEQIRGDLTEQAYQTLQDYTWVVLTSRSGVEVFFAGLRERKIDLRRLSGLKFAAIGSGTAKALEKQGIYCDYIPARYTSAEMASSWVPTLSKQDAVLLLRAKGASKVLPDALQREQIPHLCVPLYETKKDERRTRQLRMTLGEMDDLLLCSASAVEAFDEMAGDLMQTLPRPRVTCIGPVTAQEARKRGLPVDQVAQTYSSDGIVDCLCREEC